MIRQGKLETIALLSTSSLQMDFTSPKITYQAIIRHYHLKKADFSYLLIPPTISDARQEPKM